LVVPEYTLNTIVTRATRSGYVTRSRNRCILTEKGYSLLSEMITKQEEEEREINALIEDIKTFVREKYSVTLTDFRIKEILDSFVERHRTPLINFFAPEKIQEEWMDKLDHDEFYLFEYMNLAKKQKPTNFRTLEKIFYGGLISTVLLKKDISNIKRKFSPLKIFLDTNFMFSIMDLHHSQICKPAKELFKLLQFNKFQLMVFDFTIDEMVRVLQGYTKEAEKYFPNVRVDSIYSNLKSKRWTREDCFNFITKIEQKIYDLGIQIKYTGIDLTKWEPQNKEVYSRISQYKPNQNPWGQKHDIYAIEMIKEIRGRPKREVEDCAAFFLTSDLKLSKFDFIELGHKDRSTVCEVIPDRVLTNLLWLKDPQIVKGLPLETTLSIHSEILLDRTIWNRFYENITKLKMQGKISSNDVSTLIYYHQLEQDLAFVDQPDKITPDFVLREIEAAKRKIDEETRKKIEDETKKVIAEYAREIDKKDREFSYRLETIKKNVKESAKKQADRISGRIIYGFSFFLLIIGISLYVIFNNLAVKKIGGVISIISILQFFGIQVNIFKIKKKISDSRFNKIYKKRLSELKIEEVKDEISIN